MPDDAMSFDLSARVGRYECRCGAQVAVPIADLRPGAADYCGCGRTTIHLTRRAIAEQQELAGVAERAGGG